MEDHRPAPLKVKTLIRILGQRLRLLDGGQFRLPRREQYIAHISSNGADIQQSRRCKTYAANQGHRNDDGKGWAWRRCLVPQTPAANRLFGLDMSAVAAIMSPPMTPRFARGHTGNGWRLGGFVLSCLRLLSFSRIAPGTLADVFWLAWTS